MSIALPVRRRRRRVPGVHGYRAARGINTGSLVYGSGHPRVEGHRSGNVSPEHPTRYVPGEGGLGRRRAGEARWK